MFPMECKQNNLEFLVSVARISFLSLAEKINLLKNIDSASSLALLSIDEISALCGRALRIKNGTVTGIIMNPCERLK